MTSNDGSLRSVSWRDVCPWTLLFSLFRLSVSLQILILSLLGGCATSAGWRLAEVFFLADSSIDLPHVQEFVKNVEAWPGQVYGTVNVAQTVEDLGGDERELPKLSLGSDTDQSGRPPIDGREPMLAIPDPGRIQVVLNRTPAYVLVEPVRRLFVHQVTWDQVVFYTTGGLWSLLVWCLFGGAITRIAVVRLGREERVGLRESIRFARRKWLSYFSAPLLPICAVVFFSLPVMFAGLVMRLDLGVLLAGIAWSLVSLTGLAMALFAIGLLFGWPLMWSTISTEGTDAFDAISRSYAYTYQRPLQYILYVALSTILGLLGWIVVAFFCDTVIGLCDWAVAWTAGQSRLDEIRIALSESGSRGAPALLWLGATLIGFFTSCVRSFLTAYGYGFFWVATGGIYLLLRRDADQTELDDIYLEEDDELTYGLPTLAVDEAGVPGVTDVDETETSVDRKTDS